MNEIIIREAGQNLVEIHVKGDRDTLISIIKAAILKEPQLGALVLTALTLIATESDNKPNLN